MSLSVKEQLEQMINGTHEDVEFDDKSTNEDEIEITEDTESEIVEPNEPTINEEESTEEESDNGNSEDTDQESNDEGNEDTDENSESSEETSETKEEDEEENAHVEIDESNDKSETAVDVEPNYKEFYEKVALAKFTANGKEVEGFKDPEDLIRAQQMLHGFSDKMKVFKEYKKFLKPLEERGITNDPAKFNLAMSLLDGDEDAIKEVIKSKGINPIELDLEEHSNYTPKNTLPSDAQLLIEESYEQAQNLGVSDKFNKVISKDWDIDSLQEFVSNSNVRNDLLRHLQNGTYDTVQNEIKRMEILDTQGILDGMTSIQKYRAAIARLSQNANPVPQQTVQKTEQPSQPSVDAATTVDPEKAKKEAEFKKKALEKEKEVAEQRKKAASVSKKKVVTAPKTQPKLEELKGDAFRDAFREMLMS